MIWYVVHEHVDGNGRGVSKLTFHAPRTREEAVAAALDTFGDPVPKILLATQDPADLPGDLRIVA